jgi:hypothetical protein
MAAPQFTYTKEFRFNSISANSRFGSVFKNSSATSISFGFAGRPATRR